MHTIILAYGTKIQHDKLVEEINNWKYEFEGENFVGYYAPFISEIKIYDIRIPEQLAPQLLRDLNINKFEMPSRKGIISKLATFLFKFIPKLIGSKTIEPAKEKKYGLQDWFYTFNLANFKDEFQEISIVKGEKEVL